jgi:hypothetical protein
MAMQVARKIIIDVYKEMRLHGTLYELSRTRGGAIRAQ